MFINEKKEIDTTIENVKICSTKKIEPLNNFNNFNKELVKNIKSKLENLNVIQKYTIPVILQGSDVICKAPTGSGKTMCYIIPIICKIINNPNSKAVIICPVRELCEQIKQVCKDLIAKIYIKKTNEKNDFYVSPALSTQPILVSAIYGQKKNFDDFSKANILVATPGRLIDNLTNKIINFNNLEIIIFDEADRLYDSTFKSQIDTIKRFITKDVQTCMFSATYPLEIQNIFDLIIKKDRTCIEAEFELKTNVKQVIYSGFNRIEKVLRELKGLKLVSNWRDDVEVEKVIIFVEKKIDCRKLYNELVSKGYKSVTLHGDKTQFERNDALKSFITSSSPILIATSVAARGIDIKDVKLVINYDLPKNIDEYIHRIGRTGRAGEEGKAVSFYNEKFDSNMSGKLIKVLNDTNQTVPEFLKDKSKKKVGNFQRSNKKNVIEDDSINFMVSKLNINKSEANSEDEELGAW